MTPPRKFTWGETWYFDPQIFGKKYFLVCRSVDSQPNHQNCCHQLSDFKAKMHQIRLPLGLYPTPRWGAYSDPTEPLTGFKAAPIGVRARGLGRLQPPDSGKTIIFWAKARFFGQNQKPAAKNEKMYLLNEKNGIHPV